MHTPRGKDFFFRALRGFAVNAGLDFHRERAKAVSQLLSNYRVRKLRTKPVKYRFDQDNGRLQDEVHAQFVIRAMAADQPVGQGLHRPASARCLHRPPGEGAEEEVPGVKTVSP